MVGHTCFGAANTHRWNGSCRILDTKRNLIVTWPVNWAWIFVVGLLLGPAVTDALRLRGQWRPTSQFFHFLARFATEGKSADLGVETLEGNAFGNITVAFLGYPGSVLSRHYRQAPILPFQSTTLQVPTYSVDVNSSSIVGTNFTSTTHSQSSYSAATTTIPLTSSSTSTTTTVTTTTTTVNPLDSLNFRLILVDQDHFLDLYTNRTQPQSFACQRMLMRLSRIAFDRDCNPNAHFDLFRSVPCPIDKLCAEEDDPKGLVPGYQFRFRFRDARPRMWYLAFVACSRDLKTCAWHPSAVDHSITDVIIEYDIWLVNGDPIHGQETTSTLYFLARYQFSFEVRDLLLLRLAGLTAYSVLLTLTVLILSKSKHTLCRLLIAAAALGAVGMLATTISTLAFGIDGEGAPGLLVFGDLLLSSGQSCLLLILMFLARGWTVSSRVLRKPGACLVMWFIYIVLNLSAVGWLHASAISLPVISSGSMAPEWTTSPGLSLIALRLLALGFFGLQLRETVLEEHSAVQLHFYHRFAASSLVWFVSWPVVVAIASTFISPLDRQRTLSAFLIVADAVAVSTLLHIFRRSLNVSHHKVPVINLSVPTAVSGNSSPRPPQSATGTFLITAETIYFSIVGFVTGVVDIVRQRLSTRLYSPLVSSSAEQGGDIIMEHMNGSTSCAERAPPRLVTTVGDQEVEIQASNPSTPDWFEVELFSAGSSKKLVRANSLSNDKKSTVTFPDGVGNSSADPAVGHA